MVKEKYYKLISKAPKIVADIIGEVEKQNYFAHSIREIELAILLNQGKHYHITTYSSTNTKIKYADITFYDTCCEIRLPEGFESKDDKIIRLTLAHELGHLIYNIENLKNPELLENKPKTDEQEIFAWEFAYYLVKKKSDEYKDERGRKFDKYCFDDIDIKNSILALVNENKPDLLGSIKKELFS